MLLGAGLLVLAVLLWPSRGAPAHAPSAPRTVADAAGRPALLTEIADATDLLALALAAGRGVEDSLEAVAGVSGPAVALDLRRVAAALRWGGPMREAWEFAGAGWRPTGTALVVAVECGAPTAGVLLEAAARVRDTESRRLEAAAGRAAVLLVVPLGLCFLPAFVATSVIPLILVLVGDQLR